MFFEAEDFRLATVLLPALVALLAVGLVADPNDAEEPRLMLRRPGFLGRRDRRPADGGGGRAGGIVSFLTFWNE